MREGCHLFTSQRALGILREMTRNAALFSAPSGTVPDWLPASLQAAMSGYDSVAFETGNCDWQNDLELIDVQGGVGSGGRDNPHRDEWDAVDDEAHYESQGHNFTCFSHFIDLRKGPGVFDDYDGYSYSRGSASRDQHEVAGVPDWGEDTYKELLTNLAKSHFKTDEGLAYWFNDEYVHAPGHEWYRPGKCSPALERYAHTALWGAGGARDHRGRGPDDPAMQTFANVEQECIARFPTAASIGLDGRGYPFSVFMPVDNLALANWNDFLTTGSDGALGCVLHACQDATIPHHAAGTCGNWHRRYEKTIEDNIIGWADHVEVQVGVKALYNKWDHLDRTPPTSMRVGDEALVPADNWPIDQLVTWNALHAYQAYSSLYGGFAGGFAFDHANARDRVIHAIAMSAHILRKAAREQGLLPKLPPLLRVPRRPREGDVPDLGPIVTGGDVATPTEPAQPGPTIEPVQPEPDRGPRVPGGVVVTGSGWPRGRVRDHRRGRGIVPPTGNDKEGDHG